ncbi:MAG TPA: hypothetical protein VF026_14225 [Ktedonobacteraceae bacterium]
MRKFATTSLRDAIAGFKIHDFHRRTGGKFGPLGVSFGSPVKQADGSYIANYQLGTIHLTDLSAQPSAETSYSADIMIAAVKCFGTQDNDGSDSTYAVISLSCMNPNNLGENLVQTVRTKIQDNTHAGDVIFKSWSLPKAPAFPAGAGINITVSIWDHESGNADDIRDQIHAVIDDGVKKAANALAGAASADDPSVSGGTIGDITQFEVGGIKPFEILTLGLSTLLAKAFSDDLLNEKTFTIPAANIVELAEQDAFNASIRKSPDLDFDVQYNWPPKPEDEFLFSDGHGSYKIYFLVRGIKTTTTEPVIPAL